MRFQPTRSTLLAVVLASLLPAHGPVAPADVGALALLPVLGGYLDVLSEP